jgi:hypothetical protein
MKLWAEWMKCVIELRPACARLRNFMWMMVCLMGMTLRVDYAGVTSFVRALGLQGYCYDRILDFLHSTALNLDILTQLWVKLILKIFPHPLRVNERLVALGDGLKAPREGKKMPAVKCLHQESESNTKPTHIMGHSCQAIALLVGALENFFAVPLACRIHEGLVFSNRDKKTLIDKMISMFNSLNLTELFYFVADAYYANRKMAKGMMLNGHHLISRVKSNATAFFKVSEIEGKARRGRPKLYGKKVKLKSLFDQLNAFESAPSPIYGEKNVTIRFSSIELFWRSAGILALYVLVIHPTRGRIILVSTDRTVLPILVIQLYGLRYKIELAFKNTLRVIGTFVYHFWMKGMKRISRGSGNQHLHRKSKEYREAVQRKLRAYHLHIQLGLIAHGLLQYLACTMPKLIWKKFGSWLRTIRPGLPPSEQVTTIALRNSFPDFLADTTNNVIFKKFLLERIDFSRAEGTRLTGFG